MPLDRDGRKAGMQLPTRRGASGYSLMRSSFAKVCT